MKRHDRLVPLIIACPMFLQNIDMTAMTIALPSIAAALQVPTLRLNLVITAYLLSLAVFLPMSAWLADRFGAKRMFCVAISLFAVASGLCGLAGSMASLVSCRVLQGLGAALMVPVGRLILVRSVPPAQLMSAMIWFTVPPTVGRLAGPLIGGAIVSVSSWHWIFFVNIPFGLLAVALALIFVEDDRGASDLPRFDIGGFLLMALGLAALFGALETFAKGLLPGPLSAAAAVVGVIALGLYARRSGRLEHPVIDLGILRYRTFRTNVLGAAPVRLSLAAVPFLLPLMLQLGFGLSPMSAGLVAAGSAFGALCTRVVTRFAIGRYGFRNLLLYSTALTALMFASWALFTPSTPKWLMFTLVFAGGLVSSLCMISLNTLGFIELPKHRMSHATAMIGMAQQLLSGGGVVLAGVLLSFFAQLQGGTHLQEHDFAAAIFAAALLALLSLFSFRKLGPDAGAELR